MRFLIKVLSTLAWFIFPVGAPSQGAAQELRSNTVGTVVLARENRNPTRNPSWYDGQRNRLLTMQAKLAKDKEVRATKDTKPGKKTKSPSKYRP
jgi:hypothetical protein